MCVHIVKIAWQLLLAKTIKVSEKFQNHKFEKNFRQSCNLQKNVSRTYNGIVVGLKLNVFL